MKRPGAGSLARMRDEDGSDGHMIVPLDDEDASMCGAAHGEH
jgi:hypothetical protein